MLLDFGILKMKSGDAQVFESGQNRAFLLIEGRVTFIWDDNRETVTQNSCFDEAPYSLHVARDSEVTITTESECEICLEQVDNDRLFESKLYRQEDVRTDIFGAGTLNETSIPSVRKVFEGKSILPPIWFWVR